MIIKGLKVKENDNHYTFPFRTVFKRYSEENNNKEISQLIISKVLGIHTNRNQTV